jgi:Xaa-Pro dipeptidase
MERFLNLMEVEDPEWELVAIFGRINQYYLTGTMQDGVLLIHRNKDPEFWIRRSYERALDESPLPIMHPMKSFRDAAAGMQDMPKILYLETEIVPLALLDRFRRAFPIQETRSIEPVIARIRAVKSRYELSLMEEAGTNHTRGLEDQVPNLLTEGMSEFDFVGEVYAALLKGGHDGIVRFSKFNTEMMVGQVGFGESSLYPTAFDGPGGNYGLSPAVPILGRRDLHLKKGDLVFVDVGCTICGYHTDKTMTYMFGRPLSDEAIAMHQRCVTIQNTIADELVPGAVPSEIYDGILQDLTPEFLKNFMGYGSRQAKFLGHSIGLAVDETPVIARGFDDPLEEGMVIALEPKKGMPGIGMVGIENTFIVTRSKGRCITGDNPGLIPVY